MMHFAFGLLALSAGNPVEPVMQSQGLNGYDYAPIYLEQVRYSYQPGSNEGYDGKNNADPSLEASDEGYARQYNDPSAEASDEFEASDEQAKPASMFLGDWDASSEELNSDSHEGEKTEFLPSNDFVATDKASRRHFHRLLTIDEKRILLALTQKPTKRPTRRPTTRMPTRRPTTSFPTTKIGR